ncbi:GNAT family N-acetyltransferase [Halostella salina]|uniref:GNAT family N-acetyltransferase n=1 Tax=Halostella salina TaxID=1547897 RepID=UPI000EF7A93B|nr:GNAT family N-acetyltransferase [Halostella salina]
MSLEVNAIGSIEAANRNQWNNLVEQSDLGCAYHRYGWLRAVEAGTTYDPQHLVVRKKGNPVAVLPNFATDFGPVEQLTSIKPGYGGPVAITDEAESLDLLLDAVRDICAGRTLFSAIRTYDENYVRYRQLLRAHGYDETILSCRFTLDLTRGWDALFDDMDGERRRGIRRGNEQDVEVVDEAITAAALSSFYEDYATVMERVDQPTLPRSFLLELRPFADRLKLFTLRVDGTERGQYLHLLDDEQSTVQHLFTAVTEAQFEYHAAELLHEHAIRWGIDEGYATYELRGALPDFRNGVFCFKQGFGADAKPVVTWERGHPAPALSALNAARSAYDMYST